MLTKQSKIEKGRVGAFTLIELLVVVAIISLLSAILFPVFARARDNARRAGCMSNMKQIALGVMMYTQDHDEHYPTAPDNSGVSNYSNPALAPGTSWIKDVYPYVKSWQIFRCSSGVDYVGAGAPAGNSNSNYAANGVVIRSTGLAMAAIPNPSQIIVLEESPTAYWYASMRPFWNVYAPSTTDPTYTGWNYGSFSYIHFDGGNQVFADGHVKWRKQSAVCSADFGLLTGSKNGVNSCGIVALGTKGYAQF